jgi:DNA replication protein DnaC
MCEKCSDTGWTISTDEGGVERAQRCDCRKPSAIPVDQLIASSHIDRAYAKMSWSDYHPETEKQREALRISQRYVEAFPNLEEVFSYCTGLLYTGPCGTGKTHLAVCVLKGVLEKGYHGLFVDFLELLRNVKDSYDPSSESSALEVLQPILDTDILVLDDFGSHHITGWVKDTVFDIINYRYRKEKPLIVTTNLALEAPSGNSRGAVVGTDEYEWKKKGGDDRTLEERMGPPVVSRLLECCVAVSMDGIDYRKTIRRSGIETLMEIQGFKITGGSPNNPKRGNK